MVKKHWCNAQFDGVKLCKDRMRIVGPVIVPHASMVAPNDEVRTAIVLAHQGVENGLTRPSVAHRGGENTEDHTISRVIVLQEHFITTHANVSRGIVAFGITY